MKPVVGYVHDPSFLRHDQPGHPEHAGRLAAVMRELERTGLLAAMTELPAREASEEELRLGHSAGHIARLREACERGPGSLDVDTYVNEHTWTAATRAAAAVIDLALAVARGELTGGLAPVRPPGHHATRDAAMGFCLLGNVALAARAAVTGGLARVAIVDIDVHHGNGTQDILDEDPSVLFVSTHQYPHYPGTGRLEETGRGAGEGATLNIPLPAGVGDAGFRQVHEQVVVPALRRFAPELILVSAGFDAHWRDPLAQLRLSLDGYMGILAGLAACAREVCDGRMVVALEGGYDLEVLANGMAGAARVLLGQEVPPDPIGPAPGEDTDIEGLLELLKSRPD